MRRVGGRRFEHNEELDRALAGELAIERGTVSGAEPLAKPEHVHLRGSGFVENYLPIVDTSRWPADWRRRALPRPARAQRHPAREHADGVGVTLVGGLALSTLGVVRRASALMRVQHARLAENEALAVIGEIAAATAHNIRNPLASIRSTAELQRELGHMTPEAAEDTVRDVGRIERLVRTLLSYARGDTAPGGSADPPAVLRDAAEPLSPGAAARGQRLEPRGACASACQARRKRRGEATRRAWHRRAAGLVPHRGR